MITNYVNFLLSVVRRRASYLESEFMIIDQQRSMIKSAPGIKKKDIIQLTLQRNIKASLHDLLLQYCKTMEETANPTSPLQQAISCHLFTIQQPKFQIRLQELYGQQSALTTLVNEDYRKAVGNSDISADVHLKMIALVFPYEFIIDILNDARFFHLLLKTVLNYKPEKHKQAVYTIFKEIKQFTVSKTIINNFMFFAAKNPMYFALAEHFVTIFTCDQMLHFDWQPLRNFSAAEKSALIAQNGIQNCELSQKLITKMQNSANEVVIDLDESEKMGFYLRPLNADEKNEKNSDENIEIDDNIELNENIEQFGLMELKHVILEIRKIPLQPSPTAMLHILSNSLQWLQASLTIDGVMVGADETFQFFVYVLAEAKLWCLPAIISFINTYVDDALRETKYEYYINQLQCGLEFIENRLLPVQPFIVFPFLTPPAAYAKDFHLVSEEQVHMRCFCVYAFPTWSYQRDNLYPAMIRYTGSSNDVAICYKYTVSDAVTSHKTSFNFEAIPTLNGTFLQLPSKIIERYWMIKIEDGDYEKHYDELCTYSSLLLMSKKRVQFHCIQGINILFQDVKAPYRLRSDDAVVSIRMAIADVQRSLVILEVLPDSFQVDGTLDHMTLLAIKKFVKNNKDYILLTPKVFEYINSSASKKMKK